jgi:HemY protein
MTRLVIFLIVILAIAAGLDWLADRPGTIVVEWQGYVAETSVFRAFILLLMLLAACLVTWSALRSLWSSPATVGRFLNRRREQRGLDALSSGMIAIGAGDRTLALRYAGQARKALPNEPLTHLLRAQAAELTGDRATSRRIFEAMLASPDTEQLGLRGLFLEARREGEQEAARQFAERALKLNSKLDWPVEALFDLQCRAGDWQGALDTLGVARRQNLIDKNVASRRRAVLLTAQAQSAEDTSPEKALELALEAHRLAPDLVPAAAIAGRILASQSNTPRAARVLLRTWRLAPHPDLAAAYAYARPGDSPRDRLNRMRYLARLTPHDAEGPIAFAITAIDAREWDEARKTLEPLLEGRLTQRVAALMARIEGEQHGHAGRVREWLARAVNAPRDPAWTADGIVSDRWAPVSPVTGALDAFRWRVPVEETAGAVLTGRAEAMAALGAGAEPLIAHPDTIRPAAAFPATETVEPVTTPAAPVPAATAPITVEAIAVPAQAPAEPKPAAAPQAAPPAEAAPASARVATAAEDDLGERIRLAAERAIAESERDRVAATTPPKKPAVPKAPAAKPAEPMRSAPAKRIEMPQPIARKASEPKIYVPPRAPDDPGPELAEESDLEIGPLRPSGAKA